MNEQENKWFDELSDSRDELARVLKKNGMFKGYIKQLTDLYTSPAHFIYELLQNADDANATKVNLILNKKRLIFIHNGNKKFNITDPSKEEIDEIIGDINAITSNRSNKNIITGTEIKDPKIGKFGIGFKSVFKYTNNPEIYDDNYKFIIKDVFVPLKLEHDHPRRVVGKTLFDLPFNDSALSDNSFHHISDVLNHLKFPTLFLHKLTTITCEIDNEVFSYNKEVIQPDNNYTMKNTKIQLIKISNNQSVERQLFLFARGEDRKNEYSIAFEVKDNRIIPINEKVFCFFTTQVDSKLHFLIHAPFSITNSREGIIANDSHNLDMINKLAVLAGDALLYFRDISTDDHRYITSDIFNIIPIDEKEFSEVGNAEGISFKPFYTEIRKRFETEALLPGITHCVSKEHAYWANTASIMKLFSDEQLQQITGDKKAEWVLNEFGRDSKQGIKIRDYVDGIITKCYSDNILKCLNKKFVEAQCVEWFANFYAWCAETDSRIKIAKECPIFLNQDRQATNWQGLYLPDNDINLFLPDDWIKKIQIIHESLIKNQDVYNSLCAGFRLKKISKIKYIKDVIFPKIYESKVLNQNESDVCLVLCYEYYAKECRKEDSYGYIDDLRVHSPFVKSAKGKYVKVKELYLPDDMLKTYLSLAGIDEYIDIDYYLELTKNLHISNNNSILNEFFSKLSRPSIFVKSVFCCLDKYDGDCPFKKCKGTKCDAYMYAYQ